VDVPLAGVAAVAKTEPVLAIVASTSTSTSNVVAIHGTVPVNVVVATCCGIPPEQNRATPL
jgi:hypothetical protein